MAPLRRLWHDFKAALVIDEVRPATTSDLAAIWRLYAAVCATQEASAYSAEWHMGVYPAREDFTTALSEGTLFVGTLGGRIVSALVLMRHDDEAYAPVTWRLDVPANEVSVLHLLAVDPSLQRQGIARRMLDEAVRIAHGWGKRAIHLDIMPHNLAASWLYEGFGFRFAGTCPVHYDDIGARELKVYEYAL